MAKSLHILGETCMFAMTDTVRLLFQPAEIKRVSNALTGELYEEGKDYLHESGSDLIVRTAGSRIPTMSRDELYPSGDNCILYQQDKILANAIDGCVNGGNIMYDGKTRCQSHQVAVDYVTVPVEPPALLKDQRNKMPKFMAKLEAGEPVSITVIGDSITEGYNATKYLGLPPFNPRYTDRVADFIQQHFGCKVTMRNFAIAGTCIHQAMDIKDKWAAEPADLFIAAYGMNDYFMPAEEYIQANKETIELVEKMDLAHEFMMVNTMEGNPEWIHTPISVAEAFSKATREFCEQHSNIALGDVRAVWLNARQKKSFFDLTGNGVNHPNDFGQWLYSKVFEAIFTGKNTIWN